MACRYTAIHQRHRWLRQAQPSPRLGSIRRAKRDGLTPHRLVPELVEGTMYSSVGLPLFRYAASSRWLPVCFQYRTGLLAKNEVSGAVDTSTPLSRDRQGWPHPP
jgi:hypothetical protein